MIKGKGAFQSKKAPQYCGCNGIPQLIKYSFYITYLFAVRHMILSLTDSLRAHVSTFDSKARVMLYSVVDAVKIFTGDFRSHLSAD